MKVTSYKEYNGRENLLVELNDFKRIPKSLNLPGPYFHVIIFADHNEIPNIDPLLDFLDSLLERGGTAGGKIHDCVDELIVIDEVDNIMKYPLQPGKPFVEEDDIVMTTWHDDESVEDIVWFALNTACSPDICMKENPKNIFFLRSESTYLEEVKGWLKTPPRSFFGLDIRSLFVIGAQQFGAGVINEGRVGFHTFFQNQRFQV